MFPHQEIWHIAFNMLSLWWLGGPLEAALGRARYLALYLVSGLAGSALTYLLAVPEHGHPRRLRRDLRPVRRHRRPDAPAQLRHAADHRAAGDQPDLHLHPGFNISWQAHIGGLVAGVVIGYAMVHAPRERRALVQYGTCALVLAVIVVMTAAEDRAAHLTPCSPS